MNAPSPWHDPVVAEIHATRERLAEQYHNDLRAYSEAAQAHCRALGLNMAEDQLRVVEGGQSVSGTALPALQDAQPRSPWSLDAAR